MKDVSRIKLTLTCFLVFLFIDGIWLTVVAKNWYFSELGYLMGETNYLAAGLFYVLYAFGVGEIVVRSFLNSNKPNDVLVKGGLFGLVAYATYDLTNLATIARWPWMITVVDMIWGTVLTASVSYISLLILTKRPRAKTRS